MFHPASYSHRQQHGNKWWTLVAMTMACIMVTLDYYVLMVALPTIEKDLDAGASGIAWIINAYLLAFAALLVAGGRLADIFGRRRVFLAGVFIFAAASVSGGLSFAAWWMIASRAVQGIGVSLFFPASLSIVNNAFTAAERDQAIGTWTGVGCIGAALGPLLGGLFTEHLSWRWIFFVNVPLAAATIVLTLLTTAESRDESTPKSVDFPGLALLVSGLLAFVLALDQSDEWGWASPGIVALLAGAVVLLAGFTLVELRTRNPIVFFGLLRNVSFVGANIAGFLQNFTFGAMLFYLTLYLQNVLQYSPVTTGLVLVPSSIMLSIVGLVAGHLVAKFGARALIAAGMALIAAAQIAFTRFTGDTSWQWMLAPLIVVGAGQGLAYTISTTAGMKSAPDEQSGAASGILNMTKLVGCVVGIAITQAIFEQLQPHRLATLLQSGVARAGAVPQSFIYAFTRSMAVLAVVALAGAVMSLLLIRDAPAPAGQPALQPASESSSG